MFGLWLGFANILFIHCACCGKATLFSLPFIISLFCFLLFGWREALGFISKPLLRYDAKKGPIKWLTCCKVLRWRHCSWLFLNDSLSFSLSFLIILLGCDAQVCFFFLVALDDEFDWMFKLLFPLFFLMETKQALEWLLHGTKNVHKVTSKVPRKKIWVDYKYPRLITQFLLHFFHCL